MSPVSKLSNNYTKFYGKNKQRLSNNRNQTRVYERTLHDREIESTNNDESFEIIDEAVGQAKPLEKALEKLHFLE